MQRKKIIILFDPELSFFLIIIIILFDPEPSFFLIIVIILSDHEPSFSLNLALANWQVPSSGMSSRIAIIHLGNPQKRPTVIPNLLPIILNQTLHNQVVNGQINIGTNKECIVS